ncbi:Serine/threonine protein kinase [Planctomycetales bacterium 10988]|nr:Serine/threonine protein kinase [Planctomycetales bacterium 10988]
MSSTITADTYEQRLRQSGLIKKQHLGDLMQKLRARMPGRQLDGEIVAKCLMKADLLTPWQHSLLIKGYTKGFFIGKYKLLDHLGTGGMSRVYLAEHLLMRRRVALKVLNQELTESSSYLARFYRESQATAQLDHPNIVRVFDVGSEGNLHFMVMEYMQGRTLQEIVDKEGPLDYNTAATYIYQASMGLYAAHEQGLIHRDMKPGNLMIGSKGEVKLLDFGMVRLTEDEMTSITLKHNESMLGTADYLSPEQAVDSHNVDARADIYSLGCTMYFLLTGHPPFSEGSMALRLMKHQTEPPPPISNDRPDVPEALVKICDHTMEKAAEDRYQSAGEIAKDLRAWLMEQGTFLHSSEDTIDQLSKGPTIIEGEESVTSDNGKEKLKYVHWKYREYEQALLESKPELPEAVGELVRRFPGNEKVGIVLVRLMQKAAEIENVTKPPQRKIDKKTLSEIIAGLGKIDAVPMTQSLQRIILGHVFQGPSDPYASEFAIEALADYPNEDRERFLVSLLIGAESARPQGRGNFTASELRVKVASVLRERDLSDHLRRELQSKLNSTSLPHEARSLIERILDI